MTQRQPGSGECGDRCIIDSFIFPRFERPAEKQRLRCLEGDTVWPDSAFAMPACSCAAPGAGISASSLFSCRSPPWVGAPGQGNTCPILHSRSSRSFGGCTAGSPLSMRGPWGLGRARAPEFAFGLADDPKLSSAPGSGDCLWTHGQGRDGPGA